MVSLHFEVNGQGLLKDAGLLDRVWGELFTITICRRQINNSLKTVNSQLFLIGKRDKFQD